MAHASHIATCTFFIFVAPADHQLHSFPTRRSSDLPACPVDAGTGLIECPWTPGYTLTVPTTWTSGVFLVQLTNADGYQKDRKSTRLNSSHRTISYAVFCLKKKIRVHPETNLRLIHD